MLGKLYKMQCIFVVFGFFSVFGQANDHGVCMFACSRTLGHVCIRASMSSCSLIKCAHNVAGQHRHGQSKEIIFGPDMKSSAKTNLLKARGIDDLCDLCDVAVARRYPKLRPTYVTLSTKLPQEWLLQSEKKKGTGDQWSTAV